MLRLHFLEILYILSSRYTTDIYNIRVVGVQSIEPHLTLCVSELSPLRPPVRGGGERVYFLPVSE